MTREEEMRLIRLARRGNADAFEKLYTENQGKVYALALRMCGNEQDAMDVSQESFLKAYRSLDSFRGDSAFSTWLYRLTANTATDFIRSRTRTATISLDELQEREEGFDPPAPTLTPEETAEKNESMRELSDALTLLPEESRRILLLRELSGLSYEELSKELSLDLGTVKSRLNRARAKLCALMGRERNKSLSATSKETKGGQP